jgi:hypothetical protein
MTEPWIERDASGRPTGITRVAGRNMLFNKAGFLKTENGGKAELPADVIERNQKAMLKDFAIAGLTASGGQCLWDDLYRKFEQEGTASMRFFCFRTVEAGGRGADVFNRQLAEVPKLRYHDGNEWMDNANYGERFPGGGGGDVLAPGPEPIAPQAGLGSVGTVRARARKGRCARPASHRDDDRHR